MGLLAAGRRCARARLCRRPSARRFLSDSRPRRDALLFLPFHRAIPGDRLARTAAAAADQHRRRRHTEGRRAAGRRDEADGEAVMRRTFLALASIAAISVGAVASAQEAPEPPHQAWS